MGALDGLLFAPAAWFALDTANRRVPGVRPGTLAAALALVGQGSVATVVGRLRRGVLAVDVDADGAVGDAVAAAVGAWCAERDVWSLARLSGGGVGRWHVFVVPGAHEDSLRALLTDLRVAHGLRGPVVDLRSAVRPLSAPHRSGAPCPPPRALAGALRSLRRALAGLDHAQPVPVPVVPGPRRAGQVTSPVASQVGAGAPVSPASGRPVGSPLGSTPTWSPARSAAVVPLSRPRRVLPPAWASYLACGRAEADGVPAAGLSSARGRQRDPEPGSGRGREAGAGGAGGATSGGWDRSLVEYLATRALVVAGHDETSAWSEITAAHPGAFGKARERGRGWWSRWVWAHAVRSADAWLTDQLTDRLVDQPASPPVSSPADAPARASAGAAASSSADASGREGCPAEVLAVTAAARAAFDAVWLAWGPRQRHSARAVHDALLARMERTGVTTVPCPERDLLLDAEVGDRATVRAALGLLQQAGLGERLATFQPSVHPAVHPPDQGAAQRRSPATGGGTVGVENEVDAGHHAGDGGTGASAVQGAQLLSDNSSESRTLNPDARSHMWRLDGRFSLPATSSDPTQAAAVREDRPPLVHTPPSPLPPTRVPRGSWRAAGLGARSAWCALALVPSPVPLSELAVAAGAVHRPGAAPTASQLRTLAGHLTKLAALGLAAVDATGRWSPTSSESARGVQAFEQAGVQFPEEATDQVDEAQQALAQRVAARQDAVAAAVAGERAAYRERMASGRSRWARGRATALARQAKTDAARQRAWWSALSPAEREHRQRQRAARFATAALREQAGAKARWADRRARAGIGEAERHDAWITALDPEVYAVRVAERTAAHAALAPPYQVAAATAWAAHRIRYAVPRGLPAESLASTISSPVPGLTLEPDSSVIDLTMTATMSSSLTAGAMVEGELQLVLLGSDQVATTASDPPRRPGPRTGGQPGVHRPHRFDHPG